MLMSYMPGVDAAGRAVWNAKSRRDGVCDD